MVQLKDLAHLQNASTDTCTRLIIHNELPKLVGMSFSQRTRMIVSCSNNSIEIQVTFQ